MSSKRNRIDVARRVNVTDDVDDPSRTKNTRQVSTASIRTNSTEASSLAEDKEVTRKKKTVEKNNLTQMIENHGESPTPSDGDSPSKSDEERRQRFDGSFKNAAGAEAKKDKKTRSKRRTVARDSSATQGLTKRNETLLAAYYEKTEILDPIPDEPLANLRRPQTEPQAHFQEDIQDYIKKKSLVEDTKRFMGIHGDVDSRSAASRVGDLASTQVFSSTPRSRNDDDVARRRLATREDIITASASTKQRQRRWQRFDQPGAVQMQGRAYGAPPRPPRLEPTMVIGLSPKSQADNDMEKLAEDGVTFTADGPLVQAAPVTPEECAPRALIDVAYAESKPASFNDLLLERSFRWRLAGICLLIAIMTMLISITSTNAIVSADNTGYSDPHVPPTTAPTFVSDTFVSDELLQDLAPVSGIEALSTPSSPQWRAAGWLSTFDKIGLEASDPLFVQRYVMVVLYYAMGGEQWVAKEKWLDPELHECDWSTAIHCEMGYYDSPCVKSIDLSRMGLQGSIPPEIGYLDHVAIINLAKNSLNGTLPSELFNLSELTELVLNSNQLSSEIPSSISKATSLDFLDLSNNEFEGPIPDQVYDLMYLRTLDLSSNALIGTISSRLKDLHLLSTLDLRSNSLEGTIPIAFTPECNLAFVRLDDNLLSGSLPEFYGALVQLHELSVSENLLDGTIPSVPVGGIEVFEALSDRDFRLQKLSIASNEFQGSVPDLVGLIPSLRQFDFSGNRLGGTFPSKPGMWRSLEVVAGGDNQLTGVAPTAFPPTLTLYDFHGNFFTGGIPPQLVTQLTRVEFLSLANNPLGGPMPESLGNNPYVVGMDVRKCDLIGTLPDLTSLASLSTFDVSENFISGTIPALLGEMTTLTSLNLASNRLKGTIPHQIGNLTNMGVLLLQDNQLTGSLPVTLTDLGDLVNFRVISNPLEGTVPEGLCTIIEGLSVDDLGCNVQCNCCSDANSCRTA